jgi:hypothetical protein
MSTRRYTYFTTDTPAGGVTTLAERLFNEVGISDCERVMWMMEGFGPYAATTHIRLNVEVNQAALLRDYGGDSSDFARFAASGGTPSELCEMLQAQLPSPVCSQSDETWPPDRNDLILQLVQVPRYERTTDWVRLLEVINPVLAPVIKHLVVHGLDTPEMLTRCLQIQSSSQFRKFAGLLLGGTSFTEADWATHFPRPAQRIAWQLAGASCAEAVQRRTFLQRPLDIHDGACALEPFPTARRRVPLHVCAEPFAVWRRDGGYVRPEITHLLRTNGVSHRRTLDIIGAFGYRIKIHPEPDIPGFGVGDHAGSSIAEYGDSSGAAVILQSLLTPLEATNIMRREHGTDAVFRSAFNHPFAPIRAIAASRGSHLPDLMVRASCDPRREIRVIAASSVFTPVQILTELTRDRSRDVRIDAEISLAKINQTEINLAEIILADDYRHSYPAPTDPAQEATQ